ncbi:MAG: PilZ domain-containing protein [Phycisphaerales bacterium]
MSKETAPVKALRMSDEAAKGLAESLARQEDGDATSKRKARRMGLPAGYTVVGTFVYPCGNSPPMILTLRDISNGGMGILHGSFVHPGSSCILAIVGKDRAVLCKIKGKVIRCTHVRGSVHDVGIKFDEEVRLELYVPALQTSEEQVAQATLLVLSGQVARQVRNQDPMMEVRRTVEVMMATIEEVAPVAQVRPPADAPPITGSSAQAA